MGSECKAVASLEEYEIHEKCVPLRKDCKTVRFYVSLFLFTCVDIAGLEE
jgi:hypothetical protein